MIAQVDMLRVVKLVLELRGLPFTLLIPDVHNSGDGYTAEVRDRKRTE